MGFLAVDVDYQGDRACAAGVAWKDWSDAAPAATYRTEVEGVAPYEPGSFYKRELPCILRLLEVHDLCPDCILVDGHVFLDGARAPGLGKHLFDALDERVSVIGIAKEAFRDTPERCALHRGTSKKPLYVTAIGIPLEDALRGVAAMHGPHRVPTLVKLADQLCRGWGRAEP